MQRKDWMVPGGGSEAGEVEERVAEVEDLVVPGPALEALGDAGAAEVVDLAVLEARESPNLRRSAMRDQAAQCRAKCT